jgi:hypothetical protein
MAAAPVIAARGEIQIRIRCRRVSERSSVLQTHSPELVRELAVA